MLRPSVQTLNCKYSVGEEGAVLQGGGGASDSRLAAAAAHAGWQGGQSHSTLQVTASNGASSQGYNASVQGYQPVLSPNSAAFDSEPASVPWSGYNSRPRHNQPGIADEDEIRLYQGAGPSRFAPQQQGPTYQHQQNSQLDNPVGHSVSFLACP